MVDGVFDLVLIDLSTNFCRDVPQFAADLRRLVEPGSSMYVPVVLPTLKCCLRWQFDEDTHDYLCTSGHLTASFEKGGFALREDEVDSP